MKKEKNSVGTVTISIEDYNRLVALEHTSEELDVLEKRIDYLENKKIVLEELEKNKTPESVAIIDRIHRYDSNGDHSENIERITYIKEDILRKEWIRLQQESIYNKIKYNFPKALFSWVHDRNYKEYKSNFKSVYHVADMVLIVLESLLNKMEISVGK